MRQTVQKNRLWYLALLGTVILALTVVLELLVPYGTWLDYLVRGAAIYGYFTVFFSIIITNFRKEAAAFFGDRFIKIHHKATTLALILLFIHPIGAVINARSLGELVPVTSSGYEFFLFGGRQAWYLFILASIGALLYRTLKKSWRIIHWLTYIGFAFATIHGVLLGSNFQFLAVKIVVLAMLAAAGCIFVLKRVNNLKRKPAKAK